MTGIKLNKMALYCVDKEERNLTCLTFFFEKKYFYEEKEIIEHIE